MSSKDHAKPLNDTEHTSPQVSPSASAASYVYPVRSLLSGIRPAAAGQGTLPGCADELQKAVVTAEHRQEIGRALSEHETISGQASLQRPMDNEDASRASTAVSHALTSSLSTQAESSPESDVHTRHAKRKHRAPNFRDFPEGEDPKSPRYFSTARGNYFPHLESPPDTSDMPFTSGPTGELVLYDTAEDDEGDEDTYDYDPRHPAQFSEVAAEAFTTPASVDALGPLAAGDLHDPHAPPPSHFSHSGIVHLGPVENSSAPASLYSQSHSQSRDSRGRTSRSDSASVTSHRQSPESSALGELDVVHLPSTQGSRPSSLRAMSNSATGSGSSLTSSSGSEGPHITFRYQHIEDDNGHHLILGREGKLTKCEDEPIRTPGAVQGFGILIAVEEDDTTGNLVVRQVSENSTELLGLSPKYLFSLDCFSQTLPDQQADVLFDNIQYLSDTSPEEQTENLHVFTLSGWGQPQTALLEDMSSDIQRRRFWTCWVAAHRPQITAPANLAGNGEAPGNGSRQSTSSLIILEFELERDTFNPLYPPPNLDDVSSFRSGVSSPSDGSGSLSNSSGRTLVSTSSEDHDILVTPDDSSPSLVNSDPSVAVSSPSLVSSDNSGGALSVLRTSSSRSSQEGSSLSSPGPDDWMPSSEEILESTTSRSKPLPALERLRRTRGGVADTPSSPGSYFERGMSRPRRGASRRRRGTAPVGMMDVFAVMAQINEQLGAAPDLETFLKVVAGVIKDLTQFHRVLVYQFDEVWNGQVVAELVDWNQTHDLYRGLHFPATDIPAQARNLYALNKVRLLYDRGLPTARLVVRSKKDLETPLDMTHCYLRAMSPIHLKYLDNMGVRASMSVSIIAFGSLWGLVACHSYGPHGMRVSFPVRQMLRLLSQSISRNIERLSYAQRLHTRKLINTMPSDQYPSGYIVSNADDLLGLFDADYGVLVIGEGAKILGPNQHGQEILLVAEYLRLKQFDTIQVSQAVTHDYPDLRLNAGLEIIAGLLYVPLSAGGRDFIAFLRKGQPRQVHWAGRPYKEGEQMGLLEPRTSFRVWSEVVAGRCRAWADEHLETAGVLALVYGKFIEVWRQKENALQTTKLTNILLSNASHEVRTPLNHIINYLELALNGSLDLETRGNLEQSHAASKSLLFTINDLLDLTRLETGNETSFNESFDLSKAIEEATLLYRNEASRRRLGFKLELSRCPRMVVGDSRKIRTVVANLTANALKYTTQGSISVQCLAFEEPPGLRTAENIAVEIIVSDTGCGIAGDKLESIFREFEQVESSCTRTRSQGLGLGLAVVARIVEQLGGQLRVDSKIDEGSRFSCLIPFATEADSTRLVSVSSTPSSLRSSPLRSRTNSNVSRDSEIDHLVDALSANHMGNQHVTTQSCSGATDTIEQFEGGQNCITDLDTSKKSLQDHGFDRVIASTKKSSRSKVSPPCKYITSDSGGLIDDFAITKLRILIVEDNDINRMILSKRLALDGHDVVNTTNGLEGVEMLESDWNFDLVLMDIQMPLLNGFEATERIRALERKWQNNSQRLSHELNGRIPIFAVSASLFENQREHLYSLGLDGWITKPIDFKRLRVLLKGVTEKAQRDKDVYQPGCNWEIGGWLKKVHNVHERFL